MVDVWNECLVSFQLPSTSTDPRSFLVSDSEMLQFGYPMPIDQLCFDEETNRLVTNEQTEPRIDSGGCVALPDGKKGFCTL